MWVCLHSAHPHDPGLVVLSPSFGSARRLQSVLLGRDGRAKLDVGIAQLLGSQDTAPADLAELPAWAGET